jgi:hypothetical protein
MEGGNWRWLCYGDNKRKVVMLIRDRMGRFTEYSVVGRKLPTEAEETPKL